MTTKSTEMKKVTTTRMTNSSVFSTTLGIALVKLRADNSREAATELHKVKSKTSKITHT